MRARSCQCRMFSLLLILVFHNESFARTGVIAGQITDRKDYGFRCLVVALGAQDSTVSEHYSGRFSFDWRDPGQDTLLIEYSGSKTIVCPVMIKPDTITFVSIRWPYSYGAEKIEYLPKPGSISGCVEDLESGMPVQDVWVRAFRVPPRDSREERNHRLGYGDHSDHTNSCGHYSLFGMTPGRYLLKFSKLGMQAIEQEVTIQTAENATIDCFLSNAPDWE